MIPNKSLRKKELIIRKNNPLWITNFWSFIIIIKFQTKQAKFILTKFKEVSKLIEAQDLKKN